MHKIIKFSLLKIPLIALYPFKNNWLRESQFHFFELHTCVPKHCDKQAQTLAEDFPAGPHYRLDGH